VSTLFALDVNRSIVCLDYTDTHNLCFRWGEGDRRVACGRKVVRAFRALEKN
jgi:hypothetical protein